MRNRIHFHLWCELTLALWCHSMFGIFFHEMKCNGMTRFMEFMRGEEKNYRGLVQQGGGGALDLKERGTQKVLT